MSRGKIPHLFLLFQFLSLLGSPPECLFHFLIFNIPSHLDVQSIDRGVLFPFFFLFGARVLLLGEGKRQKSEVTRTRLDGEYYSPLSFMLFTRRMASFRNGGVVAGGIIQLRLIEQRVNALKHRHEWYFTCSFPP